MSSVVNTTSVNNTGRIFSQAQIMRLFLNQFNFEDMSAQYFIDSVQKLNILDSEKLIQLLTKHCQSLINKQQEQQLQQQKHCPQQSKLPEHKQRRYGYKGSSSSLRRNYQIPSKSIKQEKITKSLTDETICDVEFEVSTGSQSDDIARYACIGALFAIHSKVLNEMIVDPEKKDQKAPIMKVIKLDDIDSQTFDFLKCYVYGLDPKITNNNVIDILYCAIKYDISELQKACMECIRKQYFSATMFDTSVRDANVSRCFKILNDLYQRNIIKRELVSCFITNVSNQSGCLTMMRHDMLHQLPLQLFEMLMFGSSPSIQSTYHAEYIDDMWESCLQWSNNKLKQIKKKMRFACGYFSTLHVLTEQF